MITYKIVGRSHRICGNKCPTDVDYFIKRFWKTRYLWKCDKAVLAFDHGELIGFFRYNKEKRRKKSVLLAIGTYVLAPYRSAGVAQKLWRRAIRQSKPDVVDVVITSRGGSKLVNVLQDKYENIEWHVKRNW